MNSYMLDGAVSFRAVWRKLEYFKPGPTPLSTKMLREKCSVLNYMYLPDV